MSNHTPLVGYIGDLCSELASFRYRVDIPSHYMNLPFIYGHKGDITFIFRQMINPSWIKKIKGNNHLIYDISNNHFENQYKEVNFELCNIATTITCCSEKIAEKIKYHTNRNPIVVEEPHETPEFEPEVHEKNILWFGHISNYQSLKPYLDLPNLNICSKGITNAITWSVKNEIEALRNCGIVLLTSNNQYASKSRVIKALRAGRFVITPNKDVDSWDIFKNFIWQGDVKEGINWAINNPEETKRKISAGQDFIRNKYSPETLGLQWREVFVKTFNNQLKS